MTDFFQSRIYRDLKELCITHRKKLPAVGAVVFCLTVYYVSKIVSHGSTHIYHHDAQNEFKDAHIFGRQSESLADGKEILLSKTVKDMLATQATNKQALDLLQAKFDALEKEKQSSPSPIPSPEASPSNDPKVKTYEGDAEVQGRKIEPTQALQNQKSTAQTKFFRNHFGASIISFPVKETVSDNTTNITLPSGSYVKAKLMTGVQAPEGKTYPVLLQLDYAFIIPNKQKLDLSGCFMIAKSQGDLSTERVQMQATKLSCVGKDGRMFEREVNGFVADDKDNSFAVSGTVNSKQDRVATMAFLSSIVEGVGKAIQQAQTTQQTNALGGSQSSVTGDQGTYLAAGGAANAAGLVTQWYLKQAQNLLPTINVGSGQDVWIVMQENVKLPNYYFRKNTKGSSANGAYSYFTSITE